MMDEATRKLSVPQPGVPCRGLVSPYHANSTSGENGGIRSADVRGFLHAVREVPSELRR